MIKYIDDKPKINIGAEYAESNKLVEHGIGH